ncbi:MAG TPA: hypothetical protein VHB21_24460, partial [Minicystis sp.]|nr:hypothetical protein [Minicystis sp.]
MAAKPPKHASPSKAPPKAAKGASARGAAEKGAARATERLAKPGARDAQKQLNGMSARAVPAEALEPRARGREPKAAQPRKSTAPARPAAQLRDPPRIVALPLPLLPPTKRATVEERAVVIEQRLGAQGDDFRKRYLDSLDMSWIYHDSAL